MSTYRNAIAAQAFSRVLQHTTVLWLSLTRSMWVSKQEETGGQQSNIQRQRIKSKWKKLLWHCWQYGKLQWVWGNGHVRAGNYCHGFKVAVRDDSDIMPEIRNQWMSNDPSVRPYACNQECSRSRQAADTYVSWEVPKSCSRSESRYQRCLLYYKSMEHVVYFVMITPYQHWENTHVLLGATINSEWQAAGIQFHGYMTAGYTVSNMSPLTYNLKWIWIISDMSVS